VQTRKIAVIEDEPTIANAVSTRLRKEGFLVEQAADGPSGVELCRRIDPDVVILDVMLPGFDGIEVCRRIQADKPVAVIMLTALDDEVDKLVGLGTGADDYMTKPFSARELVARVKALLRRLDRPQQSPGAIRYADVDVDPDKRSVRVGGKDVHLTPTEFDLVHALIARPGTVFTRSMLMELIWGHADTLGSRTIDSHIRSLRRKIGAESIRTVHGVGYAFAEQES
jgi:DNA-binding response OmpR family regulator